MASDRIAKGLDWQVGIWDERSSFYREDIDVRFTPIIKHLMSISGAGPHNPVLDLGCGTGSVAISAAELYGPDCKITAVDISPGMLKQAQARVQQLELKNISCMQGSAESIPVEDGSQGLILASLSFMYVIDRDKAAEEIKRTLKAGGRFIAVVWGSRENTDIVRFQEIALSFAPSPPVDSVGPGSMGNAQPFVRRLLDQGLKTEVDAITTNFVCKDFESAWESLAAGTANKMDPKKRETAKAAVFEAMWPDGDGPRTFNNHTQYIIATAD